MAAPITTPIGSSRRARSKTHGAEPVVHVGERTYIASARDAPGEVAQFFPDARRIHQEDHRRCRVTTFRLRNEGRNCTVGRRNLKGVFHAYIPGLCRKQGTAGILRRQSGGGRWHRYPAPWLEAKGDRMRVSQLPSDAATPEEVRMFISAGNDLFVPGCRTRSKATHPGVGRDGRLRYGTRSCRLDPGRLDREGSNHGQRSG